MNIQMINSGCRSSRRGKRPALGLGALVWHSVVLPYFPGVDVRAQLICCDQRHLDGDRPRGDGRPGVEVGPVYDQCLIRSRSEFYTTVLRPFCTDLAVELGLANSSDDPARETDWTSLRLLQFFLLSTVCWSVQPALPPALQTTSGLLPKHLASGRRSAIVVIRAAAVNDWSWALADSHLIQSACVPCAPTNNDAIVYK